MCAFVCLCMVNLCCLCWSSQVQATSEVLQSVANSTTRGVEELAEREELMQELTEELEQLKQTRDEVVEKLDFAKKKINEQEIALNAAVKECDDVKNQKEALERTLKEERQKTTAAEEDQGRLQELLSLSEKSNYEIRKQLQEGKEALGIPSSDLQLTDKQLGKGSYGGAFCSVLFFTRTLVPKLSV